MGASMPGLGMRTNSDNYSNGEVWSESGETHVVARAKKRFDTYVAKGSIYGPRRQQDEIGLAVRVLHCSTSFPLRENCARKNS